MFDADRPITKSSQDRLNRTTFAKYLARCLLDHKEPDSLVVGLYGGWGAGKTSLINLTLEELNFAASNLEDKDKPIVLNFSPWSYSGQDQLIYSFFRRLSSSLRSVPYLENSNRIIHLLELYVSFFTHQAVPRSLRTKRSLWEKITFQGREEVYAWESGRDLTLIKAELNELLRAQNHKIIIIIDNISRLYPKEIRQIFQIVKSMGDYANTVYLLAFDKDQVVHALDQLEADTGENFVEKIVQLPFNVPPIQQKDLENMFADRVKEVLAFVPEDTWNKEYWADMYYPALKYFFNNCRDITRYVNTLNFSYSRLRDVVNPVDFFALTAIEVFMPGVYAGIHENKDLFTDLFDSVYAFTPDEMKKEKLRCDEIIRRETRLPKPILLDVLIQLFPRIRKIYHPEIAFFHSDVVARKLHRICSPDLFDAYFRLSLQSGQITHAEFEVLLSLAGDAMSFDQAIARLTLDGRITQFLDLLDSSVLQHIPEDHIQAIVNSLLDNGDLFPPGLINPLSLSTAMRIHRIIHGLLHRFSSSNERFIILQNAIGRANKSLYILVHEMQEQGREHVEESDTYLPLEFRNLLPHQLASLQQLVVSRIQNWADNGSLINHPHLLGILQAWRDWGEKGACTRYLEKITATDPGLIAFLVVTLDKPIDQAMTQYEKNPVWEKYLEDLNTFIPASSLVPHAKALFEDEYFIKLREREQLALMIFLDLMKVETKKVIPKTSA